MVDNENTAEAAIHETAPVEDLTSAEGIKNDAAQTTASADATIAGLVVSPLPYLTTQQPHLFITAEQEAAVAGDLTLIGVKSSPPNISVAGSDTLLITEPVLGDSYIVEHQEPTIDVEEGSIWEPALNDVLSGRGASVNSHPGNQKFRALCFSRKAMFDVANHAAKRRIATEIWKTCVASNSSRFLRKPLDKGPWYELGADQAILKAAQVMRDYKRPDRLIQRELIAAAGKKRNRATATPMEDVPIPPPPAEPIVENPAGVHEHDILCGRGAVSYLETC